MELDSSLHFEPAGVPVMSLRDYFAAKAMQGLLADAKTYSDELQKQRASIELDAFMVQLAYRYADAMLKAREQS